MESTKEEIILEAAKKVFVKYGYQKTSMEDIAKEAMIGKGSIYYYFNTKEDIFINIMENITKEVITELETKISQAKTFREKFEVFLTEPFGTFISHSMLFVEVMNEASPVFFSKIKDFRAETQEQLKKIMGRIIQEGEEKGLIKEKFANSIDKIVDLLFKWIMISGEYVKINLTEQTVNEIKGDYILLADLFLTGLTSMEEL
ncbi:MAG: TetR/AcrR family transcriptional regulator [Candidatus Cloacimonetes bacterium]|nr:TetR/AcrR family transcriptional regulator [Candidatus Cloacimonadota bacterium]